jgi:hypothetical protein
MTENNFPSGAGIASSASAFAALALAGSKAAGLTLSERDLSRLARRGSGSASRSIPGGFVEWQAGESEEDSFAYSIAGTGPLEPWWTAWPSSAPLTKRPAPARDIHCCHEPLAGRAGGRRAAPAGYLPQRHPQLRLRCICIHR